MIVATFYLWPKSKIQNPMRYLFKLFHPKDRYYIQFPAEETPETIPTSYFLADEREYERVKSLHTPLSQLSWFVNQEFNDEEEAERYRNMSDEEYFMGNVQVKVSMFIQKLQSKWFDVLKSSKKPVQVYLFAQSPLQQGTNFSFANSLDGSIQVYFPAGLIEKLLTQFKHRTYIPPQLELQPERDLLFGLDFLMVPWRGGLNLKQPDGFTDQWMYWLWTLRNQGLARFSGLQSGAGLEMNPVKIRRFLEKLIERLISRIEKGDLKRSTLARVLPGYQRQVNQIAPLLLLHALAVYGQKHQPDALKEPLRALRSYSSFYDEEVLTKAFVYARKLDFERFLHYLTLSVGDDAPMIQEAQLRKLNKMLLLLDNKGRSTADIFLGKLESLDFDFSGKRQRGKSKAWEGVRIKGDFTVQERFYLLAEEWS